MRQPSSAIWFDGYVRTYHELDLLDLATISSLPDFRAESRAQQRFRGIQQRVPPAGVAPPPMSGRL